jgi:hypothetical protein
VALTLAAPTTVRLACDADGPFGAANAHFSALQVGAITG